MLPYQKISLLSVICFFGLFSNVLSSKQRVVIKGVLMCGDKPYKGALVKLIEKDPIKDDLMGKITTKDDGEYYLDGTESEIGSIEPYLKIYHDCDDTKLGIPVPCQRRWVFELPKSAIQSPGKSEPKAFDMGVLNLEMRMRDEEHDCIH